MEWSYVYYFILSMQMNRFGTNLLSVSKKYLQPPALTNSGLLSSQDKTHRADLNQLSNVEEKSYQSSQSANHQEKQIRDFLNDFYQKRQQVEEPFSPTSPYSMTLKQRSSVVPRLEDQQVIAVQEQEELDSNKGKESVILEHIDFDNEEEVPEKELVQASQQTELKNKFKVDGQNYVINYCQAQQQPWNSHNNAQSSNGNDFSESDFKFNKIRHSKNTYVERLSSLKSQAGMNLTTAKVGNKSCIAKPTGGQEDSVSSPMSNGAEPLDINKILKKWNNEIYPRLQSHYGEPADELKAERVKGVGFDMQKQAKVCVSKVKEASIKNESYYQGQSGTEYRIRSSEEKEIKRQDFQRKCEELANELKTVDNQYRNCEAQRMRLEEVVKRNAVEISHLQEELLFRKADIEKLKEKQQKAIENERKLSQQIRRISSQGESKERLIKNQSQKLKYYQQKSMRLQKELEKSNRYTETNYNSLSPSKSISLSKFQSFGQFSQQRQMPDHKDCILKIQSLEQSLFDIQQKSIGIDLEIDKRVQMIRERLDSSVRRSIHDQYQSTIISLKQEICRLNELNRGLEAEKENMLQEMDMKERELSERENKVKKMYDELVVEWRELDKDRNRYRQSYPETIVNSNNLPLGKSFSNEYNKQGTFQSFRKKSAVDLRDPRDNIYGKDISMPSINKVERENFNCFEHKLSVPNFSPKRLSPNSSSRRYLMTQNATSSSGSERYSFGQAYFRLGQRSEGNKYSQPGQEFQIHSINSKIQKLRQQINRELDLIH